MYKRQAFFRRFYEDRYETLKGIYTLSTSDTRKKRLIERRLSIARRKYHGRDTDPIRLTVVDYLLNTGRFTAAREILARIRRDVEEVFKLRKRESGEGST